jgi:DNA-binding transcriptional LysR family regulator
MEAATTMRFILGWRCLTYRPTASTMALPMWRRTVREVSERNVDLLIARSFGPIADGQLGFEFLFEDTSVVAAGAQSPWARRRRIELAELVNEQWALPPLESAIPPANWKAEPCGHGSMKWNVPSLYPTRCYFLVWK